MTYALLSAPMEDRRASCQCGNSACEDKLPVTYSQLEEIERAIQNAFKLANPREEWPERYFVLAGHEANDKVIERRKEGFLVVESPPSTVIELGEGEGQGEGV